MAYEPTHFKSDGKNVTIIGTGADWHGYITEIEFFTFHAERIARFAESATPPGCIAYQADGYLYGFRQEGNGHHGIFAEIPTDENTIALQEVVQDLS